MENKLEKVQEELKNAKVMETNLDEFPQECLCRTETVPGQEE